MLLLAVHQYVLTFLGGSNFINSPARGSDFFSANKEGILSLAGYWCLHLAGLCMGIAMRDRAGAAGGAGGQQELQEGGRKRQQQQPGQGPKAAGAEHSAPPAPRPRGLLASLALLAVIGWATLWALGGMLPVSRRACNATYVVWVIAQNLLALLAFLALELVQPLQQAQHGGDLLEAVNRHMLPVFLAANLLTGGVNMAMNTLAARPPTAHAMLQIYMAGVCGFALLLQRGSRKAVVARLKGT